MASQTAVPDSRSLVWLLMRSPAELNPDQRTQLDRLYQLTRGVPRRVSQLADLALLAGAGTGRASIDADTVDAAWQELSPLGG